MESDVSKKAYCLNFQNNLGFNSITSIQSALASGGWQVSLSKTPEDLEQLEASSEAGVGLVYLEPESFKYDLKIYDKYLRKDKRLEWIALIPPRGLQNDNLCRYVANTFYDYHTLPPDLSRLLVVLGHAYGMSKLKQDGPGNCEYKDCNSDEEEMVGASVAMRSVFVNIRKYSRSEAPVLLNGETGTGKELAARAIHERSYRSDGPFVAINCAALPASIVQSELFGHEKGAFTGANKQRVGYIESAEGGTLFLDEVGDLPLGLQVNLLRFLQQKTIRRLGGEAEIPVDIRIIAATHVDLEQAVRDRCFREDLYFRLNVLHLTMPALNKRKEDVIILAKYFINKFASENGNRKYYLSQASIECMMAHSWPGNIRELINRIRRAMVMSDSEFIELEDLGFDEKSSVFRPISLAELRTNTEVSAIKDTLAYTSYNLSQAARVLAISRPALYRLMDKYCIVKEA